MKRKIVFAAAGSAGHIEPALAVATVLQKGFPDFEIVFLGTRSGLENELLPRHGFPIHYIEKVVLPRSLSLSIVSWPISLLRAVRQADEVIKDSDLVVGFGGYVSAAAYLAARRRSVPIVIHESNIHPGWANRLGARWSTALLGAYPRTRTFNRVWKGMMVVGSPLRPAIENYVAQSPEAREKNRRDILKKYDLDPEKKTLVVFGGSQGSAHINSVISEVLPQLLKQNLQLVHALGKEHLIPPAQEGYRPLSYIADMAGALGIADLVIARSGAMTCQELAAVGKFAILVPLPHGNGEQILNAGEREGHGMAEMILDAQFTSAWLLENLSRIMSRAQSAQEPSGTYLPHSAQLIATQIEEVLGLVQR